MRVPDVSKSFLLAEADARNIYLIVLLGALLPKRPEAMVRFRVYCQTGTRHDFPAFAPTDWRVF